jgi:cytochrome b561
MRIIDITMKYMRERQPPVVRYLHFTILCLVLSQIIISNFMGFADHNEVSKNIVRFYGTWIHIGTGLFLVPIAFVFICIELKRHGFKYFFPYVYGDFSQLRNDVQQLLRFRLPEPGAYGIAAAVQGLGLGALSLVLLSGFTWFLSWVFMAPWSDSIRELHELLTGLIEAYVVGHGGMGLLHLFLESRHPENR